MQKLGSGLEYVWEPLGTAWSLCAVVKRAAEAAALVLRGEGGAVC